jgi:hypothetical protein
VKVNQLINKKIENMSLTFNRRINKITIEDIDRDKEVEINIESSDTESLSVWLNLEELLELVEHLNKNIEKINT